MCMYHALANFTHFIQILLQSTLKHFNNQKVHFFFTLSYLLLVFLSDFSPKVLGNFLSVDI